MKKDKKTFLKLFLATLIGTAAFILVFYIIIRFPTNHLLKSELAPKAFIHLNENTTELADKTDSISSRQSKPPQIRVAIGPIFSPEASLRLFEGIVNYLGHALNRDAVLVQRSTYAETNQAIRNGECDIAFVCSFAYLRGAKDFDLEPLAVPVIDNKVTYYSYIIVPVQSKANSLLDLKGLRFASADIFSNSGWLFPVNWLISHGKDPKHFFSEHIITGGHDNAIIAVSSGLADGAAVASIVYDQLVFENPALADRIRIIMKSPPYGMPPLVCRSGIDSTFKKDILFALLHMHQDVEGQKALSVLRFQKFVMPPPKLFDPVKNAIKEYESLK